MLAARNKFTGLRYSTALAVLLVLQKERKISIDSSKGKLLKSEDFLIVDQKAMF